METLKNLVNKAISGIENTQISFSLWLASFSSIIIIRLAIENFLKNFETRTAEFIFFEFAHTFTFFLLSYIIFVWILARMAKVSQKQAINVILFGFLIILTPPIWDYIISGGQGYWSFYKFDGVSGLVQRFFTFFGDRPEIGITYGVRIEVALAVLFIAAYIYIKSGSYFKTLKGALFSYTAFFVLGTLPSYFTILIRGFEKGIFEVTSADVAAMFLSPAKIFSVEHVEILSSLNIKMSAIYTLALFLLANWLIFKKERAKFLAFWSNARLPQVIYHAGLLLIGITTGGILSKSGLDLDLFTIVSFALLILGVISAWMASVAVNDCFDVEIDKITNSARPLVKGALGLEEYKKAGIFLFIFSIFAGALVSFKIALLLLVYQAIAWVYSAWPFRLKRYTFVSVAVSAAASMVIFFAGFMVASPDQNIENVPGSILALLFLAYAFSLSIKDFKDIAGDTADGVYTIPVVFGENWGRVIVGSGMFLSFLLSVIVFNENKLFLWALLFGAISYWIMQNKKINPRNVFWWILLVVVLYLLVLAVVLSK